MTTQKSMLVAAVALATSASVHVSAGVKSMTSDEMTETFIKDTTIIVAPAQKQKSEEEKDVVRKSLTISPGEAEKSEAEVQLDFEEFKDDEDRQLTGAIANYEEQVRREMALRERTQESFPPPEVSLLYSERLQPNIPGFQVPEGDFNYNFLGNQLGLSRDNDQLTMSFGNLPGVDQINIPNAVNEGPIQLAPRPGGGFDLKIDIPQNNQF